MANPEVTRNLKQGIIASWVIGAAFAIGLARILISSDSEHNNVNRNYSNQNYRHERQMQEYFPSTHYYPQNNFRKHNPDCKFRYDSENIEDSSSASPGETEAR